MFQAGQAQGRVLKCFIVFSSDKQSLTEKETRAEMHCLHVYKHTGSLIRKMFAVLTQIAMFHRKYHRFILKSISICLYQIFSLILPLFLVREVL